MDLNWRKIGNPDSENVLVFLHEGLGCIEMWKDYPETLCRKLNACGILYDRSGYGKSSGSLTNRTDNYLHLAADELALFINELGIQKPILYGHSDGGSIALIYGATYGNIKAIVTEAAHVFNEPETIAGVMTARPLIETGEMDGLKKYHGDRYKEVFYAWNNIWLDPSFKDWNITDLLTQIHAPLFVIQGKNDQYGTLKQVDTIKKLSQGNTTTFTPENCGHAPFKEKPELVMNSVINFIKHLAN